MHCDKVPPSGPGGIWSIRMRALRALVLLALCAWVATNWFHREPVRRTLFPVHATASLPPAEHLTEKARSALAACLAGSAPPMTMDSLATYARERTGLALSEVAERRLVRFRGADGNLLYLTWRPEPPASHYSLRLFSLANEEAPQEIPLSPGQRALPAAEAIEKILDGTQVLSDLRVTRVLGKGLRSLTLATEDGQPRSVRFEEPGVAFECSSSQGPVTCACETALGTTD